MNRNLDQEITKQNKAQIEESKDQKELSSSGDDSA